jgi:hypothetical protein
LAVTKSVMRLWTVLLVITDKMIFDIE